MYNYPAYYGNSQPFHLHCPAHSLYYLPPYTPYGGWDHRHFTYGYGLWEQRDFPKVDTTILSHSLTTSQNLLKDAALVIQKLHEPEVASQLMTNAQQGNQKEVDRIVHSFGCTSTVATTYSPSSVKFTIDSRPTNTPYCEVTLSLKWGE